MDLVHIVGAGGIGCALGYALAKAGARVCIVDVNPAKVAWGRSHGVGVAGLGEQPAEFRHFDQWFPGPDSTIFLCTKCYDNANVLQRLQDHAILIPVQNGFDPALNQHDHELEGIASFVSECCPDRPWTRITRQGKLHLGYRGNAGELPAVSSASAIQTLARVTDLLRHAPFQVVPVRTILPYKYTKLMYNAAISPLAAAAGLDNGQLLAIPKARQMFFHLLRENYGILQSAKVKLGKIGPFHPDTVNWILRWLPIAGFLSWFFYPTLRKTYCSMAGDLPRGRTEIDYYNRHLIDLSVHIACPLNQRVYDVVKRMERERLCPGIWALDEIEKGLC